jgi:hypothetical protein
VEVACVGELPGILLRPAAVEAAGLVVTAGMVAACLLDHCGSQAVAVRHGLARHAARGHSGGLAMGMGNLPAVGAWRDLEWV